jgi:hypothetical protein
MKRISPKHKNMKSIKANIKNETPTPPINGQQMFYATVNGMPVFHVFDAEEEKKNNHTSRSKSHSPKKHSK